MKRNNFLAIACALLLGMVSAPLCAQERGEWSMTVGADAANANLWRGMELGGPCLQPSAYFDYERGDWAVSLGTWATTSLFRERYGDYYDEFDFSVDASWRGLTLSLANYNEYYDRVYGGSFLDLGVSYTVSETVPVTLSWYSILGKGLPSYFEMSYDFSLSVIDCSVAAGCWPYASDYYGNERLGVCNLDLRAGHEFEFSHGGSLPVSAQIMYNPAWSELFWAISVGYYFSIGL